MIHLDTSFLIRALARGTAQARALRVWLREGKEVAVCTVGWAEFLCGPVGPKAGAHVLDFLAEPLPFLEEDARRAAELFNVAGRKRGSLMDCMIAASALRHSAPLATANPSDFRLFEDEGLEILP